MSLRRIVPIVVVLLVASAVSAQKNLYCPAFGTTESYPWSPNLFPTVNVQTTLSGTNSYQPSKTCIFIIEALIPGRVVIDVTSSRLSAFSAAISIRTNTFTGYIADWNELTYSDTWNRQYVSPENRLYIAFTTRSSPVGIASGVRMTLSFLGSTSCLPGWSPMVLTQSNRRQNHCVGGPTSAAFKFGDAQRYCNQMRSNLLVSEGDKVSTVLGRVGASNMWIGMTAEPSGSSSYYRWISNAMANESVSCTGGCTPGSTKHRCVYPMSQTSLVQADCGTSLRPLCSMPAGGTDNFFGGSATTRASGALLAGAALLLWGLLR